MVFNQVIVFGAGAIGSLYGALLSQKIDTILIGRRAHIEAVQAQGLKLTGDIVGKFFPKADVTIREIQPHTLILLTTKAHDSASALAQIEPMLRKDTVLAILQNGLGNAEEIREKVEPRGTQVLRGLTTMAAELLEPGVVRVWNGQTTLAAENAGTDIATIFNDSGLETQATEDIAIEVWRKLALNCVINPLTALLRVRNEELLSESLRWIRNEVLCECCRVAEAEQISLELTLDEIDSKIRGYSNFSSMYQDVAKGKRTEIGFLNGKIVELGVKHSVRTPVNQTLTGLITFKEDKTLGVPRSD